MFRHLIGMIVVLAVGMLLLPACGFSARISDQLTTPAESVLTPIALSAGANPGGQPKGPTLSEILPSGRGFTLLLSNCSACHSVVCAVRGQRTVARWESLKKDYRVKVATLSESELQTLFSYLAENFNSTKPEPNLPVELVHRGSCNPSLEPADDH